MRVDHISLDNENIGNHMTDFIRKENGIGALVQKKSEVLHFFAMVEFGVPSKNCKNYGICRLNPIDGRGEKVKKNSCKSAIHITHITYYNERWLEMVFQKSSFEEECKKKYFASRYFKVDEDFSTNFQLDLYQEEKSIIIRKGKYPIIENKETYIIKFHRLKTQT